MSKHTILACLAAAVAAAGCTANMNASVTPTLPGASASAAVGASAAPGATPSAGASATPAVSASAAVAVNTGVADAAMLKIYKQGRKWVYDLTTAGLTVEMAQEVVKIEGATATIKTTTTATIMGQTNKSDSTGTVDLSKKDFATTVSKQVASGNSNTSYTWQQISSGNESLTVPAGTYACTKWVGKLVAAGTASGGGVNAAGSADVDTTYWTNDDVGLVRVDGTSKNASSASTYEIKQMPDLSNLPGGMPAGIPSGMGGVTTSTAFSYKMTLKSVTQ